MNILVGVCVPFTHCVFKKKKFYIILDLCFSLSIYWLFAVCYKPMKTLHFNSIKLNQHGLFSDFVVTISSRIDHEEIVYETTFTKTKWMHIRPYNHLILTFTECFTIIFLRANPHYKPIHWYVYAYYCMTSSGAYIRSELSIVKYYFFVFDV